MERSFTPEAKKFWESIPPDIRKQLLNTAWCGHCGKPSSMHNVSGKIESGLLVLRGNCKTCSKKVLRVTGTEKLRSLVYKYLANKKMEKILQEINL